MIIERIDTKVLAKAKKIQNGRVSSIDTNVSFTFSEGWFRTSGLYEMKEKNQEAFIT